MERDAGPRRRRGRAPWRSLTRERVLTAAIALADAEGIESLSMRRLAQALGAEAMSLYYYFARKEELLAGMLDAVFVEMEPPPSGPDWRADIRRAAVSSRDVLLAHPWAAGLLMSMAMPSLGRLRWMDALLGRLRAAGFSAALTHHAYHALDSHIVGFVLWVLPYLALARKQPDMGQRARESLPLAELPHLAEHIGQHLDDRPGDTSEFEFGLDLLLDGLERLRVEEA